MCVIMQHKLVLLIATEIEIIAVLCILGGILHFFILLSCILVIIYICFIFFIL